MKPPLLKLFVSGLTRRYYANIVLRDYQEEALNRCITAINQGCNRIGVSLATGGGKTVVFSKLIDQLRKVNMTPHFRALVLVHRRELAFQASTTIQKLIPELDVQLEMGSHECDVGQADVIVASVQSLVRRLDKYNSDTVNLIVIDEAHHAVADSYLRILRHFNADSKDTRIPVVGFSATFERMDNKALSTVLDEIVYHKGVVEMINDKWLCEGKFTTVGIHADLSNVEVSSHTNDFQIAQLSKVMNTDEVNKVVLATYLHKKAEANLKSTLLFGVDIAHVKALHELFSRNNIKSGYVVSGTADDHRDTIINDFKNKKIEILLNCGIFTEGTDIPNIDSIFLCRPTCSRPLLAQMIGRGLRLHHSKEYCHIVDFIGSSKVGIVSVPTLLGIPVYNQKLDGATLEQLHEIRDELNLKRRKTEEERLEQLNTMQEKFKKLVEESDALDLTLATYNSFEQFCQQQKDYARNWQDKELSLFQKEEELLRESKYIWLKFAKNAWASPLLANHHLRLYKERVKDENGTKNTIYTLKLYREIPKFIWQRTGTRFSSKDIIQDSDILRVLGKADKVVTSMGELIKLEAPDRTVINFTKFAHWRRRPASEKQQTVISSLLHREYLKNKNKYRTLKPETINNYVASLSMGNASSILFIIKIAPVFPVQSLLHALEYKKKVEETPSTVHS